MAKLFDFEQKEIRRKNLIKALICFALLFSVTLMCFVYYEKKEEKAPAEVLIGVHVKGAVVNSGFYQVPLGTRIKELGDYAGGFCENADLDGVNLAGYVYDGQEVYVPYKGSKDNGAININTATEEELRTISGIGEKYARAIIRYRESHNGFTNVIELKEILSESTYEAVREMFYIG